MKPLHLLFAGLSFFAVPLLGCAAEPSTADAEPGEESTEALSTSSSLIGSYARQTGASAPMRGMRLFREAPGKPLRFVLDLDPLVVPGICDPVFTDQCVRSRLEGRVTKVRGNASAGSFTLTPAEPQTVPVEAAPYYGPYTFARAGKTLTLGSAQGSWALRVPDKDKGYCIFSTDCMPQLPDDRCVERSCDDYTCSSSPVPDCDPSWEPLEAVLTDIEGTWKLAGGTTSAPYSSIALGPGSLQNGMFHGTFTAVRSPSGGAASGSYDVGPPNEMIGLAPWLFHESGGADVALFIGSVQRDPAGKVKAIGAVPSEEPSKVLFYERQ